MYRYGCTYVPVHPYLPYSTPGGRQYTHPRTTFNTIWPKARYDMS